jgi:hypothetical protein
LNKWFNPRLDKGLSLKICSKSVRSIVKGFQTGDIIKAIITSGKKIGTYIGRVVVRSTGSFNISTASGLVQGLSHKYCKSVHKKDSYGYGY